MGGEESKIEERVHSDDYLSGKIAENLKPEGRLMLSHQSNIWQLCNFLAQHYSEWQIAELHLEYDMVAGEVIEELTQINFEKAPKPLRVIGLSHNDIQCDNLKFFRKAHFNCLFMLYLDHNKIASDGCYYISKTSLPRLQTLDLSHNLINQVAAGHLATSNFPSLVHLIVSDNKLSYKGVAMFATAEWPSLAFLQAKNNSFEPRKQMQDLKFRTEVKMFRLQLQ